MDEFVTAPELRDGGWTEAMVREFLGEPDDTYVNPHWRSGPPGRLWLRSRVNQVMASPEWRDRRVAARKRRRSSAKAVETKRAKLQQYAENVEIVVPVLPVDRLVRGAIASYNTAERRERDGFHASIFSDLDFLDRICRNYLRHEITHYEHELAIIYGKVGVDSAYAEIKARVMDEIDAAYPTLQADIEAYCARTIQQGALQERSLVQRTKS